MDFRQFIIDQNNNVVPATTEQFIHWQRDFSRRVVAVDMIAGCRISTVFLMLDHGHGGRPLFFETMGFKSDGDSFIQERYGTYDEALQGHKIIVDRYQRQALYLDGLPEVYR